MNHRTLILLAGLAVLWLKDPAAVHAEETVVVDEIIVTATPLPTVPGKLGRAARVVTRREINATGATSAPEALEELSLVSIRERGSWAVQSDVSIRGSTYQQVLVSVDGISVSDPQTAHHNMDLPFPIGAVGQIEVIPGPGSALFGPSAFGGTVNVVTRRPEKSGFRFLSAGGSFNGRRFEAAGDIVRGRIAGSTCASYSKSDGFRDGTDHEMWSIWNSTDFSFDRGSLRISAGHTDKDFGAREFYTPFPSRERTSTTIFSVAPQVELASEWKLRSAVQYRRHTDEFILIEDNPSFYRNDHRTESLIERVVLSSTNVPGGALAFGVERRDDLLDSSNLGDRDASTNSVFVQHRLIGPRGLQADLGLRVDDHSNWGTELSPTASLSAPVTENVKLRLAGGRAVRPPSFVELYYTDPNNIPNPDLEPEEAWGVEAGFDIDAPAGIVVSATYFRRDTDDAIDLIRDVPADPWQTTNVGQTTTTGVELALTGNAGPARWRTAYRRMDVEADNADYESKYALNYARDDLAASVSFGEGLGWGVSLGARYRDVPTLGNYCLVNARTSWRTEGTTFFISGSNLLDEDYEEIPDVPGPECLMETGFEFSW